jgi:hypothetical protein
MSWYRIKEGEFVIVLKRRFVSKRGERLYLYNRLSTKTTLARVLAHIHDVYRDSSC